MTVTVPTEQSWGSLSEPIHADAAAPGDPIWKDNAYLSFWDSAAQVFGTLHVSTSPNAATARRARASVSVAGRTAEVVEELAAGTFTSASIHFGLDGRIRVEHPDLRLDLVNAPLFVPADYAATGLIPDLVPGQPLRHLQQACTVTGVVTVGGIATATAGHGMRDRTWGFRDEAAQWVEYAGLVAVDANTFVSAMKFLGHDGSLRSDGFVIDGVRVRSITDIAFARNAAAQFLWSRLGLDDGSTRTVRMRGREAGFWVPMGPAETEGPSFGTYDDFMALECEGSVGGGFFEQGIVHRVA